MVKKCVYCNGEIAQESAIDVCDPCGVGVWGPKMFKAIRDQMSNAKDRGDLHQGLVNAS